MLEHSLKDDPGKSSYIDIYSSGNDICIYNKLNNNLNNKLDNKLDNKIIKEINSNKETIVNEIIESKEDKEKMKQRTIEKVRRFIKNELEIKEKHEKRETNAEILTIEENRTTKIRYDKMQGRPSITIKIKEKEYECLLDTGARINVISKRIVEEWHNITIYTTDEKLRCANDSRLETIGKIKIDVLMGERKEEIEFLVVESIKPDIIGGIELQKQFDIELKWKSQQNSEQQSNKKNYICEIEANFGRTTTDEDRYKKTEQCLELMTNKKLQEIIKQNKGVFMADNWDIGCTKIVKHEIKTKGGPIRIKPRRQPANLEEKIEEAIENLRKNGIIRECNSPWNTPLVCVWKKERKDVRLCMDFRQLNLITERQAFPMPNVDEMLDRLNGSKYFSSIDLGNAYYQIELEESSQEKTAFSAKDRQYCFTRMPFGIAAAPGTFQEMMVKVLKGMEKDGTIVYLDDILIFTKTEDEHYKTIEKVLERIKEAGLRINPEKCHLFKQEVKFLGHIINKRGIQTDPGKIEAIKTFDRPKCIKNLRSFLGICNYYRRFIKEYSRKARALEEICGKNKEKLVWTDQCDKAFTEMKAALTEAPILAFPDFRREFILDTDASFDAIGAVLSQEDDQGREKVIAYGSHAMSSFEKGYCITRKELLAIYYFCQHYNHYLYGKRFRLRTDHKAITFMLKTKNPITAQFQTWINYLSSLDIKMEFRKGINHGNADMLSRSTCDTCTQCLTQHEDPKTEKMKTRQLATMIETKGVEWQEQNTEIESIKERAGKLRQDRFRIKNGIVYTIDDKIWIPKENRKEMIKKTHRLLCHAGVDKVIKYMKNNFDMDRMTETTKEVIQECEACQRNKVVTTRTKEDTKILQAREIFEKIYIDICGPWRETRYGEKYIMAIIDQFSRYISLTAIKRQDEDTIEEVILKKWILRFGAPREIHVDCGKSFEAGKIKNMAEKMKAKLIFSSPYHHNTNGIVERQFRTIREWINATVQERKNTNWEELLPEIEYTLNATVQKTTERSPAEIVYGKKINRTQWYENDGTNRNKIWQEIRDKTDNNKESITRRQVKVGQEVLIKKEIRNKNQERYEGPYRVIAKNHERSYKLQDRNMKIINRNIEQIKNFKKGGCEGDYPL